MRKPAEPVDVPPPTVSGRFIREPHETVWRDNNDTPAEEAATPAAEEAAPAPATELTDAPAD